MSRLGRFLALGDFEAAAKRHLPRPVFGYVSGASEEGRSFHSNRTILNEYGFVTRVLRDMPTRSQQVELFGKTYASAFGIAPMGINALSAYRGDLVLARAAMEAGIVSVMSSASLIALEEVGRQCPGTWFQAYLPAEDARIDAMLDRIEGAGFEVLMITVDVPVPANRENNVRAGFTAPLRPSARLAWQGLSRPRWLWGTFLRTLLFHGVPHFENTHPVRGASLISSKAVRDLASRERFSWSHIDRIRQRWRGRLVIKGVLHVDDALQAQALGVDAVILSNHGGRQLDGAVPALAVLEQVVAAVGSQYPILVDGGFRRGTDILKALSLGARMVLVGRPFNYAAAVAGEDGVRHAISLLKAEIDRDLALLGVASCAALGPQNLVRMSQGHEN
ncbi:alpha-hydroxy acid oxidase [Ottowia thiooxydans]|uniref:alpha-hydroxy acid oxidase n=1 Tax=Ottowia thiooxydans TaxID=219182 RepID=UPI0003F70FF1|nr:alpha-hydroxy acid oxidase [Ottowia thiooxydans]